MSEQDARAATDAGMTAAQQRYSHYEAKTHGLDATCGDPMPAESTLQSAPVSEAAGESTLLWRE